jgi:ABC-2 type transport system permease protein
VGQRVRAQAAFETQTLLRNGEQLLVSLILPALALAALVFTHVGTLGPGRRVDVAVPGVLALAIISTAFTGQAISTGFDRRYGVLRLLGVSPLGRGGLLAGRAAAVLAVEAVQLAVLGGLAWAWGWRPEPTGFLIAALFWLLGTWAFVAWAMVLAGTLRAEAVLALANLVWVLLLGVGGVVVPADLLPSGLSHLAAGLPSGALGDGLRAAFLTGSLTWGAAAILLAWAVVGTAWSSRVFRWSD